MNYEDDVGEQVCLKCKFFMPDENSCSDVGICHGMPVATVGKDGFDIVPTPHPRRKNYDKACRLFLHL